MALSASPEEVIQRPLQVIETCFERTLQQNNGDLSQNYDWGVTDTFRNAIDDNVLEKVSSWSHPLSHLGLSFTPHSSVLVQIPVVNKRNLQQGILAPNTLVRYRGMVQDIFSPEYFQAVHQVTTSQGGKQQCALVKEGS